MKVGVDAYDGNVTFYLVDPDDPIAAAYAEAFPELFTAGEDVPDELRAHFRYPEDLFRIQTNMWGRYHIGDPTSSTPSPTGGTSRRTPAPPAATRPAPQGQAQRRMDPYYLQMRLPDDPAAEFLILQPFVPFSEDDSRRELSGVHAWPSPTPTTTATSRSSSCPGTARSTGPPSSTPASTRNPR